MMYNKEEKENLISTIYEILRYKKETSTSQITDELNSRFNERYSSYHIYPLLNGLRTEGRVKSRVEWIRKETYRNGKMYIKKCKTAVWSLRDGQ